MTLTYVPKVEPLLSGTSGKVQQAQTAVRGRLGNFHKHAQVDFSRHGNNDGCLHNNFHHLKGSGHKLYLLQDNLHVMCF